VFHDQAYEFGFFVGDETGELLRRSGGHFSALVGKALPDVGGIEKADYFGDEFRADAAIGAGTVLNDERLPHHLLQPHGEHARHDVRGSACRGRGYQPDRFGRIGLRRSGSYGQRTRAGHQCAQGALEPGNAWRGNSFFSASLAKRFL
jgi:hypothetical protein